MGYVLFFYSDLCPIIKETEKNTLFSDDKGKLSSKDEDLRGANPVLSQYRRGKDNPDLTQAVTGLGVTDSTDKDDREGPTS